MADDARPLKGWAARHLMVTDCLNCGAALQGSFCAACGQRSVPPDPSVAELAGDAWQELSGYDGRIAATIRGLLRPGYLTREYIAGRRARYLSPMRLYLIVSVIYFVAASSTPPSMSTRSGQVEAPGGLQIGVTGSTNGAELSAEERAQMLASGQIGRRRFSGQCCAPSLPTRSGFALAS